jgi:hypothetical protein
MFKDLAVTRDIHAEYSEWQDHFVAGAAWAYGVKQITPDNAPDNIEGKKLLLKAYAELGSAKVRQLLNDLTKTGPNNDLTMPEPKKSSLMRQAGNAYQVASEYAAELLSLGILPEPEYDAVNLKDLADQYNFRHGKYINQRSTGQ